MFVRSTSCFSTSGGKGNPLLGNPLPGWGTNFLEDPLLGEPFLWGTHFPWVTFLFWEGVGWGGEGGRNPSLCGGEGEGIHLCALHFLFPHFRGGRGNGGWRALPVGLYGDAERPQVAAGQGAERHLRALGLTAVAGGEPLPELFRDLGYARATHFRLCTLQVNPQNPKRTDFGPKKVGF